MMEEKKAGREIFLVAAAMCVLALIGMNNAEVMQQYVIALFAMSFIAVMFLREALKYKVKPINV